MKRTIFAAGALAVLACSGLLAQTANLTANIPFHFQIDNAPMPAGPYLIHCDPIGVLTLRTASGKSSAIMMTLPATEKQAQTNPVLLFKRYGDSYFLSGVWAPTFGLARSVPESRREKEVASRIAVPQATTVALSRK